MAGFAHHLPAATSEADLLALVAALNADEKVDGILVQLPLPGQIDAQRVIEAIDPAKDVDGFHPVNAGRLATGLPGLVPCTPLGCLHLLQQVAPMPADVLDVGCGSGILALAALQLGAERATGLDTDPLAVSATRENAERNGLGDRVTVFAGTLPPTPDARYPLVLANLVAAVLIELAPSLAAHLAPGGVLLASGIIEPRAAEVIDAMRVAGLAVMERSDDGEWVSLRLEHAA